MSYLGSTPTTQSFIAGTDSFNGTGSATNFTLSRFVNSVNDIQVVVNNVVQYPPNYSVSGNTLTISPAPSAGTNNVYVRYLSTTLQSITIPGGSSVVGNFGLSGNLQFLGSAQRITGDFSNATIANRAMFQTSTANGATRVEAIPNGTGTTCNFAVYNNSDPTNASATRLTATSLDSRVESVITGTGTYLPMTFYTGGSERMRVDTSGNVGIGTSSPSAFGGTNLQVQNSSIASILWSNGTITGQLLCSSGAEVTVGSRSNHPLRFGTNDTERARIDTSGTLFIGATSSPIGTQRLVLTANGGAGTEPMLFNELRATAATENYVRFYRNGSQVGSITNTLSATAYVTSSDYRLKENVQPMTGALAKITQLKPCTYTWKLDGSDGQGFIAHELAEVVPDAVSGEKDAVNEDNSIKPQGIDTSFLVATLTAAIQEQQAMIDTMKKEIAELKAKVGE